MNTIFGNKTSMWKAVRDYILITIAMTSYCIGWTVFLLPNNITTGGVPGIASIVYWGTGIPVQVTYFSINAVLLLIALKVLGMKFCVRTIYAVFVLTILLQFATPVLGNTHLLESQPFMASIIGAVFTGSGIGLGLAANGSSGGTDIIAAIVHKYHDISLGKVVLIVDILIITSSYIVLRDWERVIYGYVVLTVSSFAIDQVVGSLRRSVQFFIISDKYEEIGHRINKDPHRGCTVINAQGFYSGHEVKLLFVLAKKNESPVIFRLIEEIDPNAFVSQSAVIGVYGEGFDKMRKPLKKTRNVEAQNVSQA